MNRESGMRLVKSTFAVLLLGIASCGGGQSANAPVAVSPVGILTERGSLTAATGESVPLAQFVQVTGTTNTGITWKVSEGVAGGSITAAGVYRAPNVPGTYHVVAASQAKPTVSATITINVGALVVTITPVEDTLGPAGERIFTASASAFDGRVTWSVLEGDSGGTMNGNRYTAPAGTGTYHVVASSVVDPSVSIAATMTIVSAGFRPIASMLTSRVAHTVTRLQNGEVLIAGGDRCGDWYHEWGNCMTATAELFDPATGMFSATGAMLEARVYHTATLLPDGKVLIAGGDTASAELYDPVTGTFAVTGSMGVMRSGHTEVQLLNGRVLVAGGNGPASSRTTAEVYDPQSGTFSPTTAGMTAERAFHTGTRLADGRVLIAGGEGSGGTAELYDPATNMFSATGSMGAPRVLHSATLLGNGTILITGGWSSGSQQGFTSASAEVYDPATGGFSMTGAMLTARQGHIAALLPSGRVLVSGGDFSNAPELAYSAEVFDPSTGLFTQTGSMTAGRPTPVAVSLSDGRVMVVGGAPESLADIYQ